MIIHIWMHWFWITTLIFKGFLLLLSRHVLFSSSAVAEAGLLDNSLIPNEDHYVLLNDKFLKYASHDEGGEEGLEERSKRAVEDDDVVEETTTASVPQSNETMSNESTSSEGGDVYNGAVASDAEDTYNGGSQDGFLYPLKKYMKYGKYNKLKLKPKTTEENVGEAAVTDNTTTEASKTTATIPVNDNSTSSAENTTAVVNSTEIANQTVGEEIGTAGVNQTVNETATKGTVEVESTSVVAKVTEARTSEEVVHIEGNLTVENKLDESMMHTTVEPFAFNNRVAAATSSESRERLSQPNLDAGSITGITLGIVVLSGFIGAISFVLYRRRYLNKPQALNDKCSNLDSNGYIDDTSLRENSEEMYSLDNDSFLNSLEAMTIQNYWTENVKHTKL